MVAIMIIFLLAFLFIDFSLLLVFVKYMNDFEKMLKDAERDMK